MTSRIGIVVLAAGASTRMGTPKQVLPWAGVTLLEHCTGVALSLKVPVTVVLGAHETEVRNKVDFSKVDTAVNRNWMEGMGSSIAVGMRRITSNNPNLDAVLILLGDQPFVDHAYLKSLLKAFFQKGTGIVATDYGGSLGVPAVFGKEFFPALLTLKGLTGAKTLLETKSAHITAIPGGAKTTDIDYPGDYESFRQQAGK